MIPLGCGQFKAQGPDKQDLCRGPLNIATYKIYKLWASRFQSRRFFFLIFPITRLWELMIPGVASLDPRGLIGRICVGGH